MNYINDKKPITVPNNAQWLGGVGAGSWFVITEVNNFFSISEYVKIKDKLLVNRNNCHKKILALRKDTSNYFSKNI